MASLILTSVVLKECICFCPQSSETVLYASAMKQILHFYCVGYQGLRITTLGMVIFNSACGLLHSSANNKA